MKFARLRSVAASAAFALAAGLAEPIARAAEPAGDRAIAEALVGQLEHDSEHRALVADSLARAREALERGTRLRAAQDELHARAADGLAREWAETARDLVSTVEAETRASNMRRKARDAQAQLERTRALVEEGIARLGRLRAAIAAAAEKPTEARTAVEVHDGDPKAASPPAKARKGRKAPHSAPAGRGPEVTP